MASLPGNAISGYQWHPDAFARRYAGAHFGKSLFWHGSEMLYAFFLTEIAGASGSDMAIIVAGGLVFSAAIDIWLGRWLSARNMALRDASRLQWIGALASAGMVALIAGTAALPVSLRLVYGLTTGMLFRLAYGLYDIAQNSMLALATNNTSERTKLSALRLSASGCASLVIAGGTAMTLTAGSRQASLAILAGFAALCATGSALLLARARIPQQKDAPTVTGEERGRHSARLWPLYMAIFLTSLSLSSFVRLEPYYVARLSTKSDGGSSFIVAAAVGLTLSQPLWYRVARQWGSDRALLIAASLLLAAFAAFYRLFTFTPTIMAVIALLFGIANGGIGMTIWAGFAERIADTGQIARAFGELTASSKLGLALSAGLVGWWVSCDAPDNHCPISMTVPMALIPAIGVILAMGCLCYPSRHGTRRSDTTEGKGG